MITATTSKGTYRIHFAINRGEWFSKTWLVQVGMSYTTCNVLVEAGNAQDAIDTLADSNRSYLIDTDVLCNACEQVAKLDPEDENNLEEIESLHNACECDFAGNDGHRVDLDNVWVERCKVDYFAKPE